MANVSWRAAWHDALYAAGRGFSRAGGGPAAHFSTATQGPTGMVLAGALFELWGTTHDRPPSLVVDFAAGRGELSTHLLAHLVAARESAGRRVLAVDVSARPGGLDDRIEWERSPGGAGLPEALRDLDDTLVVAHEWLDVVPCTVAEVDAEGALRLVLVDPATGVEAWGGPLEQSDVEWCATHWPVAEPGDRVEVGSARDSAWRDLVSRVRSGLVVAVDYGHTRGTRPPEGTLTAYGHGRQRRPVPDGSCDITAHVAIDSLGADQVLTQRALLRRLGLRARPPDHALAARDPTRYLRALETCTAEAALIDPTGFGAFWWAVSRVPAPDVT